MRFKLRFATDKPCLPIEYRRLFTSYIKNALSKSVNGDLINRYYTDTNTKDFTWTLIVGKPKFTPERLEFSDNKFSVIFSTDDKAQTGMYLMLAFLNQKNKKYPAENGNFIILKDIVQIAQKEIRSNDVRFTTMPGSSIVVREHDREFNKDTYYCCDDEDYESKLEKALRIQAQMAGFPENAVESIKVQFISGKKVVVKHYGVYLDASIADFIMSGSSKILQHFYQNGICSRRSIGFGMLDIVEEGEN